MYYVQPPLFLLHIYVKLIELDKDRVCVYQKALQRPKMFSKICLKSRETIHDLTWAAFNLQPSNRPYTQYAVPKTFWFCCTENILIHSMDTWDGINTSFIAVIWIIKEIVQLMKEGLLAAQMLSYCLIEDILTFITNRQL